jgi:hypothetical protein
MERALFLMIIFLAWGVTDGRAPVDARHGGEEPPRMAQIPQLLGSAELHEVATPLGELFERLSRERGVRLDCPEEGLKEQKVIIHATQDLGTVLDRLAETLGAAWVVREGGGYRLVRTRAAQRYARTYLQEREREAEVLSRARLKRYQAMIRIALRGAAAEGTPERTPPSGFVHPEGAPFLPALGGLSRQQVQRLFAAGTRAHYIRTSHAIYSRMSKEPALILRLADLPPAAAARLATAVTAAVRERSSSDMALQARYIQLASEPDLLVNFGNYFGDSVNISLSSPQLEGWAPHFELLHGADRSVAEELTSILTPEEQRVFARFQARLKAQRLADWPVEAGRVSGAENLADAAVRVDAAPVGPGRRPGDDLSLPQTLLAIHKATHGTVIADYFTRPQRLKRADAPATLHDLLTAVSRVFGRNCRASDGLLTFRSVSWPADERAEVPSSRLQPWLAAKTRLAHLPGQQWLEMGRLSEEQLLTLCEPSDVFGEALVDEANCAMGGLEVLGFYHRLSPPQQELARSPRGLRFDDLRQDQRLELLQLFRSVGGVGITLSGLHESFRLALAFGTPEQVRAPRSVRYRCHLVMVLAGTPGIAARLPVPGDLQRLREDFASTSE